HQGSILLKVSLSQELTEFHLRRDTPHKLFLQNLLSHHQFLMAHSNYSARSQTVENQNTRNSNTKESKIRETIDPHFDIYRYFSVKHGYQFNCNTGRALWKNWRAIKRLSSNASKLLIRSTGQTNNGKTWTEIQSIGVSNELIFIETADHKELVHNFEDAVQWLNKVA
ncbi:MAG: hypothetical protein AAFZ17_10795, partial [Cyanobacteria bacterium J06650_10]